MKAADRPTIEPNSQLGQVLVAIGSNQRLLVNSSGRAQIKTGQSCGVAVPLTAILYSTAGTVVQVVQAGYMIGDRILRPALVGVSKGGAKAAPSADITV